MNKPVRKRFDRSPVGADRGNLLLRHLPVEDRPGSMKSSCFAGSIARPAGTGRDLGWPDADLQRPAALKVITGFGGSLDDEESKLAHPPAFLAAPPRIGAP
jgi:hypothetical protein